VLLAWAAESSRDIRIPAGLRFFANVAFSEEGTTFPFAAAAHAPDNQLEGLFRSHLGLAGVRPTIKIVAVTDEGDGAERAVAITWQGTWNSLNWDLKP